MQNCNHYCKVKKKKKWDRFGWVFCRIFSRKNGANANATVTGRRQLKRVESNWIRNESSSALPPDSPLYKSYPFLKLLQMRDEQQKKATNLKPKKADKKKLSFSRFLLKKLLIKTKSSNEMEDTNSSSNNNNVGKIAEIVIGRQPSQRLKMPRSLTKMPSGRELGSRNENDEVITMPERGGKSCRSGDELCKKRILMGVKCKPLMGGILQYDTDGVLKPDIGPLS